MTLLAVPNVSEGKDAGVIEALRRAADIGGVRVLDVHADPVHNRSVFTMTAAPNALVEACVSLAAASRDHIDLTQHRGVHPRLGSIDVCPFVPHNDSMEAAVSCAHATARAIGETLAMPAYLYGEAASRAETKELPALRRGGLSALQERAIHGLHPDAGPTTFNERTGVVCVGARGPLIAFNVWLESDLGAARAIAASVRSATVRALGLAMSEVISQVSMNLIDPAVTGIEEVFEMVQVRAADMNAAVISAEIVGLVEERFLPSPNATVTRLLQQPGHSLEASLGEKP